MSNNDESSSSRLNPESKLNEDKNPILDSKEFIIKNKTDEYHIKIEINNKYIYFTLSLSDRIVDSSYQNKYDLNAIVRLLNLIPNKYTDLSQVLKFIEKAYSMNKITITPDEFNVVMSIKIPIGFEEEEYKLTLYKVILSNNEIINQIVKELNLLKKIVLNDNNIDINNFNTNYNSYKGRNNNNLNYKTNTNPNGRNNNISINEKINELNNRINNKDSLINELIKKMNIKDKEIKDIYSKLRDKNYLINEMNKTLKIKDNQMLYQDKERIESINQLKIKDEEIKKKLNEQEYEINNKLIDKDNALNEINKKLIEKDYIINVINNKLNDKDNEIKKQNEKINELKRYINKINEENNYRIDELKNLIFNLDEVKIKYKGNYNYNNNYNNSNNSNTNTNINNFNNINISNIVNENSLTEIKSPQNLKFKEDIVTTNTKGGLNDIFEIYTSLTDNKQYLISPNKNNYNLDVITLSDNKLQFSLKGHLKKVTNVRYFLNSYNNNEYLISADEGRIVILWDISNNFSLKYTINTQYNDIIYSCLLMFDNNDGYIITSTYGVSDDNEQSATKIYSLENKGEFVNYINNTNNNSVYYLLSWMNKKNNKNYIIQFSYMKIFINDLENELYAELTQEQKISHYSGFVYETDSNSYLYSSSKNGFINVWDLYNKKLINNINVTGSILCHMIQWDERYAIVADYNGKSFKIIDIKSFYVVKDINGEHNKEVKSIKKIKHPLYGDSLLSAGNDYTIKLWCI